MQIKFLFVILISTFVCLNVNAQIAIYGQCGGYSYTGPYICATGLKCYKKDTWFAQCLTSCPSGWECNNPLVPLNGQCGGVKYCGLTSCDGGLTCFRKDSTYSACLYSCPTGWDCNGALLSEFSQCGGLGYTGNTKCSGSLKCFSLDNYFSQCLSYCPSGWNCTDCTTSGTTTQTQSTSKLTTLLTTTTTSQKPVTTTTSQQSLNTLTSTTLRPTTITTTTTTTQKPTVTVTTTNTTTTSQLTTTTLVTIASNDVITYVDYGGKISSEDQLDIYFKYNSDASRTATVSLFKPSENKVYATKSVTIKGGTNLNKAVTLTRSTSTPIGAGYIILIQFLSNNLLTTSYSLNVTVEAGKQGFHCYQGKVYDANKAEFLMRGINNVDAYWDNYNRWYALNALDNIAQTGANVVRIVWLKYLQGGLTILDLDTIITRSIQNKLIPMIELHDATGSSDANYLNEMAQHLADQVWLLIKYRKYILVNIANEWSPWGTAETFWRDSYKTAITTIRNAGYSGPLVIDASAYAQNPNGPKWYGQELLSYDPFNNLIFSIHMYAQWSNEYTDYKIINELNAIKNVSIPLIVGEFANQHPINKNGNCYMTTIDAVSIMQQCTLLGFGYLGWAWSGNGNGDCGWSLSFLDIALNSNWEAISYSTWGNILINTASYGIRATSKLATIF